MTPKETMSDERNRMAEIIADSIDMDWKPGYAADALIAAGYGDTAKARWEGRKSALCKAIDIAQAALADGEYLDAIIDYAFDAAFRAYDRQAKYEPPTARERATVATQKAVALQAHAERVQYIKEKIILLNQEMPNGMRARNCTLDYMYRLGGAYRRIGKQGSKKLVGSVYDEGTYRTKLQGLAA